MCKCFFPSSTVFASWSLTCRFLYVNLCGKNKNNYVITKWKGNYKYSLFFFFFFVIQPVEIMQQSRPQFPNPCIKVMLVMVPQWTVSFSSLYILQLSSKNAFRENWWQAGIYWIPVDKNTLSEVLEIIVFCVFNNLGNCCLVLLSSLLCWEPPCSADVCPGAVSLSLQPMDPCRWEILPSASSWHQPQAWPGRGHHLQHHSTETVTQRAPGVAGCSSLSLTFGVFRAHPSLVIPWERAE